MDRKTYLNKVTKRARNFNIAKLYFEDDLSSKQIKDEYYPELSVQAIFKIAKINKNKYKEENAL